MSMQLPFTTPLDAVQCYVQAVATKTESAAMAASTKEGFAPGPAEGPGPYFHNFVRLGIQLEPLEHLIQQQGDVAVVPAAASREGFPPAPVFFLLKRSIGNWRIAGMTKSPAYAKKAVMGEAPLLLDLRELPPAPDIVEWAEQFVARYDGDESAGADVPGLDEMVRRWRAFVEAPPGNTFIKRTVAVPWFDRAAVLFVNEVPIPEAQRPARPGAPTRREERMTLVAQRKGDGWEPVWFGHDFEPARLFVNLS